MTAFPSRPDRHGRKQTAGELLDSSARVPVYHAYGRTDSTDSRNGNWSDYAVCGRLLPIRVASLPIMHLDKFARPCRRCWDAA